MTPKPITGDLSYTVHSDIDQESRRALLKHGAGHMLNTELKPITRLGILVEEVGEVATAIIDEEGSKALYKELIQVATMAAAWAEVIAGRGVRFP